MEKEKETEFDKDIEKFTFWLGDNIGTTLGDFLLAMYGISLFFNIVKTIIRTKAIEINKKKEN